MVNENLGAICNAHVVHADLSEYGALDEKCLKLAELAALAVDFPKTGKDVIMPSQLKPKLYPDFMGKEEFKSYKSTIILGKLYRQVKDAYNEDVAASSELASLTGRIPYDRDLEIPGSTTFIAEAWNSRCIHDRQLIGLLGQYNVNREEEVVTGHIWSMPKNSSKKQGELKERLKHAYSAMRKESGKFSSIWTRILINLQRMKRISCTNRKRRHGTSRPDHMARASSGKGLKRELDKLGGLEIEKSYLALLDYG
ncbi:hypothetical protein RJ639_041895 [Escallonia herrerae]|uniref:RNA-dependent RNA polymerase n=1 Tax=Escallonia herrerae TaxID=1293975 RepID=A0AA88WGR2_9ASTE|nr:hypothetical protein RJ639_041895 [Escallonia herrerae]